MKTILASLTHHDRMDEVMEAAISVARLNDGHVIGYYPIPGSELMTYTGPSYDYPFDDTLMRLYEKRRPEVKETFEDRMRRSGVSYEWRSDKRGEINLFKGLLEHGRTCDLIIMGHEASGAKSALDEAHFIADTVMASGRPVLAVPPANGKDFKLDKVAIGWNASKEACRAAFDSLPLLTQAKEVTLTWVNPEKKPDKAGKLPGAELAAALARHGVSVTAKGVSNRNKTSRAIVNMVKEDDIDLLVIGAYGRSRLRERVLGGVTEYVLRHLPCPVLFSN